MFDVMLGKGFKASKCKTLLRLAMARIKLLRNKRDIQVKQMRKEIAQLLTTGQEPSARIRVEHIIREQNILAAYDILELFCELVAVRLPIIESQKTCPLDLKEAISSLIFASPRCSDLPELLQIRALFAAKYGKEFAAAAAELRPDCGVNRRIIEKLSVRAPPGEVKLKLMKEIAAEHNVDWDATDAEAELTKVHEDLLDGPTDFMSAHLMPLHPSDKAEALPSVPTNIPNKNASTASTSEKVSKLTAAQAGVSSPQFSSKPHEQQSPSFKNIPPPTKYEVPSPTIPRPQKDEGIEEDLRGVKYDSGPKAKEEEKHDYMDVAAAALAAAKSADRAVAAAQAAADLARKHKEHESKESNVVRQDSHDAAQDDSSCTDLDSDSEDGGNVAVKAETSQSRSKGGSNPAPTFDTDSDVEEYDVPRGRGPSGTKAKHQTQSYKPVETHGAHANREVPPKASRLDFESAEASRRPIFDDDSPKEVEDSIFSRAGKQERDNRSYGGDSTSGKKGGGLKWHSKTTPEDYEPISVNREESLNPHGAFGSTNYYSKVDEFEGDDLQSRSFRKYTKFEEPHSGASGSHGLGSSKLASKSQDHPSLFVEEGSVGRSQKTSRFGTSTWKSGYDEDIALPASSPPKPAFDDLPSSVKTRPGGWARRGLRTRDSTGQVFGSESSPRKDDYDDVQTQFDNLKMKR